MTRADVLIHVMVAYTTISVLAMQLNVIPRDQFERVMQVAGVRALVLGAAAYAATQSTSASLIATGLFFYSNNAYRQSLGRTVPFQPPQPVRDKADLDALLDVFAPS